MYHIVKQTRVYDGDPYCGYSSDNIPMEFNTIEEAVIKAKELQLLNPVGWNVFDSSTRRCVYGKDMFKCKH